MTPTSSHAEAVWRKFCQRFDVTERSVPLFAVNDANMVVTRMVGRAQSARPVLARSPEMEALVLAESAKLVDDWRSCLHRYDGLIYCMGWRQNDQFVPLY